MITDVEVVERIQAAISGTQMVVDPAGEIVIFAEDKQRELPGKSYVFYWKTSIQALRPLFEPPASPPQVPFGPRLEV